MDVFLMKLITVTDYHVQDILKVTGSKIKVSQRRS